MEWEWRGYGKPPVAARLRYRPPRRPERESQPADRPSWQQSVWLEGWPVADGCCDFSVVVEMRTSLTALF